MAYKDCVAQIQKAFRGNRQLSQDDVMMIAEELQKRQRAGGSRFNSTTDEWTRAADDFILELKEAARIERINRKRNKVIESRLMSMAEEANTLYNDPSLALDATLVGILRPLKNGQSSAGARYTALYRELAGGMARELDKEGLMPHFNSGQYDEQVALALEKMTKADAPGSADPIANKIATVVRKYQKIGLDLQNRAGAWKKPQEGFVVKATHDPYRMMRAGTDDKDSFWTWRDAFLRAIDTEKTFAGVEDPEQFMRDYFASRISGTDMFLQPSDNAAQFAFAGPGNLARKISTNPDVFFKDAGAWHHYNKQFGMKTLRESLLLEFDHAARNVSLLERLGTNPEMMLNLVSKKLKQKYGAELAPKQLWREQQTKGERVDTRRFKKMLDVVDGSSRIPANVTAAKISSGMRAWKSMAVLGLSTLSSISDIASKGALIHSVTGRGLFQSYAEALTSTFAVLSPEQRTIALELADVGADGKISDMAARFSAEDNVVGAMSNATRIYFKLNLQTPWTDGNKAGIALVLARHLAMEAEKADFDSLAPQTKLMLRSFGLGERHWNVAKIGVRKAADGRNYLFPDEVLSLTDKEMRDAGLSPRDREHIAGALRMIYSEGAEAGIPTPGARERMWLTQAQRPGTPLGEALRFMTMLKSFPVTVGYKTVGRIIYSNPDGKADLVGLAAFIASSTVLGYVSLSLKDMVRGLGPRDPSQWDTIRDAMTQGGGLGLYGDLLLGETSKYGQSLTRSIVGPVPATVSDLHELWDRTSRRMQGEKGVGLAPNALRLLMHNTPGLNLFYTRAAMDYLILYQLQELANPGYLRRRDRKLEEQGQQSYILPQPSRVIPYGGGSWMPGEAFR